MRLSLILFTLSAFQQRNSHSTYAQTSPTRRPSPSPTFRPTRSPTTRKPSPSPTTRPTRLPTLLPTPKPSPYPTPRPTRFPTPFPTPKPSASPTPAPTRFPTSSPTPKPSSTPTLAPTKFPTSSPTPQPSPQPSPLPTSLPTSSPTPKPSFEPTFAPTNFPTSSPTPKPSPEPSISPTRFPTASPTPKPSASPTPGPTRFPTPSPTRLPTPSPTSKPSPSPTPLPSFAPTPVPTLSPTRPIPTQFPVASDPSIAPNEDTASTFACPPMNSSINITTDGLVSFLIPTSSQHLCTLIQHSFDSQSFKPVGRSYAGYDWEASSGEFASLGWSCNGVTCSVNLPPLPVDTIYVLTSFYPPEQFRENGVDEVARFLEQTTFGVTNSDISKFDTTNLPLAFGNWIKEQQESVPATSHRAFFRLRTNSRMETATRSSAVTHPCHKGSTYRRASFSAKDNQKYVSIITVGSKKIIKIDGFVRTVVNGPISNTRNASVTWPDGSYQFVDTANTDRVGGDFQMYLQSQKGNVDVTINGTRGNPIIQFDSSIGANPNILIELTSNDAEPIDMKYFTRSTVKMQEIILTKNLDLDVCASILEPGNPVNPVFALYDGVYWIHDPKFDTFSNTLESPFPDGGGKIARDTLNIVNIERSAFCANVERDVFNEKSCVLSYEPTACAAGSYDPTGGQNRPNFFVPITPQVIRDVYEGTGNGGDGTRYLYAVDGLRIQEDKTVSFPCQRAGSRWIPINCTGAAAQLDPTVHEIFSRLLKSYATDTNPYMRDIWNWWGTPCPTAFQTQSGFEVLDQDGTKCWKNVHPDHLSVYDFTFWTRLDGHPGNSLSRNPIKEFAEAGLTTLKFPWWHSMSRWVENEGRVGGYVGRLGDTVHYYNFPKSLKSEQMNQFFGFSADAINYTDSKGVMVCGSPNEIENDLSLGGSQGRGAFDVFTDNFVTSETVEFVKQKRIVWTHIALTGPDQLRQRMAWALSQILVVSPGAVSDGDYRTEAMTAYYDIFVRHAFGSYRDILKEVSYSGVMGQMLTYHGSRSTAYTWRTQSTVQFADENYAREIMQLFTIGMYKMRQDGTLILDSKGFPIRAYTNDDIVEYARVWTGFETRLHRGNVENVNRFNLIDSMKINMEFRDVFPKMGLDRKYIGDGYPLCADLPEKHFLKTGATYRLLGSTSTPELVNDPKQWASDSRAIRLKLQSSGPDSLFAKLCGSEDSNACNYRTTVTLDSDLLCNGPECSINTLRVVEVGLGIFYEYVSPPCVYQAFYTNAKAIIRRTSGNDMICADPRIAQASTACCNSTTRMWNDVYWGERVTFATAGSKCNQQYCDRRSRPSCDAIANPALGTQCVPNVHYWSTSPCTVRVKINSDGTVAIVHSAIQNEPASVIRHVQNETKTYFRVDWSGVDSFKSILSDCNSIPTCAVTIDEVCVCNMTVEEEQVYFDGDSPTIDDVLKKLTVGSFEPSLLASNWVSQTTNGVTIYSINGQLTSSSIFEVTDSNGVRQLRKNMKSNVKIIGKDTYFRNPVHFISLSDPAVYQAYHETDAALDQYFYHSNTAPFLAIRFAQRFGISNPSPGFVSRIAAAFKSGTFTYSEGGTPLVFGTGKYGNLGATIASILLDREARTTVLDSDPVHGSLREPLIKILGLMRALEFKLAPDAGFIDFDININLKIGQMAHALPNVFSFFNPFFTSGIISEASLVAPEAQVMTGPRSIDFLNGLLSLVKFGLSYCYGGVGRYHWWAQNDCSKYRVASLNDGSLGNLTFAASDSSSAVKITDELATLLTAGRLSRTSRQVVDDVIRFEPNQTIALLKAQQLILLSPEFHATNIVRQTGALRPEPQPPVPSSNPYKAVVYILLDGGMDSYNLIVPNTCTATNVDGLTVLEQYNAERTTLAMTADEKTRIIDATGQPCSQFAIHKDLEIVERLYKAGDLSFFVNAGVLNQPVNKDNYWRVTKTGLFGHNTMQEEAQQLDPFDTAPGTGVLGRMCDILKQKKFKAQPVTVQDSAVAVVGVPGTGIDPLLVSSYETNKFNPLSRDDSFLMKPYVKKLNQETETQSSLYGEMWSQNLNKALNDNDAILKAMSTTTLNVTFPNTDYAAKLRVVSTLIGSHQQRGTDRDVFYLTMGGWDHHSAMKASISSNFIRLNDALTAFYNEMQAQGKWNGVTVVFTSDFARTLTANSGDGSDHAWGGHYFVMGGAVKGGKIHGSYPSDITNSGPLNIGRGRIIPTLSWESVLNPIVEWMGVDQSSELNYCMPNRIKSGAPLISVSEMFK